MIPTLKISIITPSFNQAPFLEEALWSVKRQGYPLIEHIIMDGGSTDGSVEILKRYSSRPGWEHLRWRSEPDNGQSDALNKGFRLASGDVIGWLNSDDRYRAGCFTNVMNGFELYPATDVIYGDLTFIDEDGAVWSIRREIEFSHFMLLYLHMLYVPSTSSFFRRRIFDEGNWIDTNLHLAMDYEFILRLSSKGYKFHHISELLADFRFHPQSKSGIHTDKQREEHNAIGISYSSLLKNMRDGLLRKCLWTGLRALARGLRYSEKLYRGYYLEQFTPKLLSVLGIRRSGNREGSHDGLTSPDFQKPSQ